MISTTSLFLEKRTFRRGQLGHCFFTSLLQPRGALEVRRSFTQIRPRRHRKRIHHQSRLLLVLRLVWPCFTNMGQIACCMKVGKFLQEKNGSFVAICASVGRTSMKGYCLQIRSVLAGWPLTLSCEDSQSSTSVEAEQRCHLRLWA